MEALFLQILNMSFVGGIVILLILLARIVLKKAPKVFSYALWVVVLLRLVFPFSFESVLSLIPVNPIPISTDILYTQTPQINTGIATFDYYVNASLPAGTVYESVNPMQIWTQVGSIIWIIGMSVLLTYGFVSLFRLKIKLRNATYEKDNIYRSNVVETPFVLGAIRPKIYLPILLSESEIAYVVLHEQTHINRFDHVLRIISYLVLCVHWFNPLVWIAFYVSGKDMEMSCDESVIRHLGDSVKKDYSTSLLTFATGRKSLGVTPLAFGEGDIKGRIKNVMHYKKPMFWLIIIALIGIVALSFGLLTNPKQKVFTVEQYADQYIQRIIDDYENSEYLNFKIVDHEITALDKIAVYENITNYPIELWSIEYRLKPDDIQKVMLAGGMNEINGWITESSSMGKPVMIISYEKENPEFIGLIWTGEMGDFLSTKEIELRKFLGVSGKLDKVFYPGEHHIVKFKLSTGESAQGILSQPATQGSGGIWCVERWMDGNGNVYYNDPQVESTLTDYYDDLQKQSDEGHKPWLLNPLEVSFDFIGNTLGQAVDSNAIELLQNSTMEQFSQTPTSRYIGYISNFAESYPELFHFDPVEWLTLEDTKRLEALGIKPDEITNGYYINNPQEDIFSFNVNENTKYTFMDWGNNFVGQNEDKTYSTLFKEEFITYLNSYSDKGVQIPFWIETKDGYVISITEQYVP